jgi:hypothetical protein
MSGPFRRVEDLLSIPEISQGTLGTPRPYLKFTPRPPHRSPRHETIRFFSAPGASRR